jgi:hypothetical protein
VIKKLFYSLLGILVGIVVTGWLIHLFHLIVTDRVIGLLNDDIKYGYYKEIPEEYHGKWQYKLSTGSLGDASSDKTKLLKESNNEEDTISINNNYIEPSYNKDLKCMVDSAKFSYHINNPFYQKIYLNFIPPSLIGRQKIIVSCKGPNRSKPVILRQVEYYKEEKKKYLVVEFPPYDFDIYESSFKKH